MQFLKNLWQAWTNIVTVIAEFVGQVVLSIFYFTVFMPFGLGATLFGDLLKLKENEANFWLTRQDSPSDFEAAKKQF